MNTTFEDELLKYHAPVEGPPFPDVVLLACKTCGHWKTGQLPKDEVMDWLRVHRSALLFAGRFVERRESSCPNPCQPGEHPPRTPKENRSYE